MGLVLYLFGAIMLLLIGGWIFYVLPVPGELSAWELSGAFFPALLIMGGVVIGFLILSLSLQIIRFYRRVRRKH